MSIIAAAVKHMLASVMAPDAIVSAVADMEAAMPKDEQAERRRAADRERKRLRKSAESAEGAEQVPPKKETSPTPPKEKTTPSISEANASSFAALVDQAFDVWDAMAQQSGLAKARVRSQPRRTKLSGILRQHGMDVWREACRRVGASSFCRGEKGDGWKADLDFVLQAKSFGRILEGHYDDRARGSPSRQPAERYDPFKALAEELDDGQDRSQRSNRRDWDDAQGVPFLTIEHH